jgi:hypothetical protein
VRFACNMGTPLLAFKFLCIRGPFAGSVMGAVVKSCCRGIKEEARAAGMQEAHRGADGVLKAGSVSSAPYFAASSFADSRWATRMAQA